MIENQNRVRHTPDGRTGTVCPDLHNSCGPDEVAVVFDGINGFDGMPETDLEDLGPENAIPELDACGAGKGDDCCIFLTVGPNGFDCERYSSLRWSLIFKSGMSAKRNPTEPYPQCMNQGETP